MSKKNYPTKDQLKKLKDEKFTSQMIADKYSVSTSLVKSWLSSMSIVKPKKYKKIKMKKVVLPHNEGMLLMEKVAEYFGDRFTIRNSEYFLDGRVISCSNAIKLAKLN